MGGGRLTLLDVLRLLAIVGAIVFFLIVTSCSRKSQILDERWLMERQKMQYIDRVQRDTVNVRDSIVVFVKGDTVRIDRWRDRYIERVRSDTVVLMRSDTVRQIMRCYTEKSLTWFERVRIGAFPWLILAIVVLVVIIIGRRIWK